MNSKQKAVAKKHRKNQARQKNKATNTTILKKVVRSPEFVRSLEKGVDDALAGRGRVIKIKKGQTLAEAIG